MTQHLHTVELWDYLATKLAAMTNPVYAKVVRGSMEKLPNNVELGTLCPIAFIRPQEINMDWAAIQAEYWAIYRFRIIHVMKMPETGTGTALEPERVKTGVAQLVTDMLIDNIRFAGMTALSNAYVVDSIPEAVELEPTEDNFVASVAANLTAFAITLQVRVRTKRV